ncbi:DUF6053 domain-containing protein [Lysobacter enzymogenes]|uniref:DUF6053 domain-containing protein n=1 Tax=Lysobacter enzymogenes TaxID=69 RepID=UPI0037498084
MAGPSGPTPFDRIAMTWPNRIGPEGPPPTAADRRGNRRRRGDAGVATQGTHASRRRPPRRGPPSGARPGAE